MYSNEEIKELIKILEESSLSVLEIQKEDGSKVRIEKAQSVQQIVAAPSAASQIPSASTVQARPQVQPSASDNGKVIKAPIVGVFYAAPSPDAAPYVTAGKQVKKGDTVCIIEAMKCMNEIQAEEDGEIVEVLAADGELVEYDQPLFRIK